MRARRDDGGPPARADVVDEDEELEPLAAPVVARALANLAGNDENKLAIAANGGIMPLIMLLRDSHPPAREEAARALVNLAVDDDNKVAIAQAGGVMPLITCLSPRRAYYV